MSSIKRLSSEKGSEWEDVEFEFEAKFKVSLESCMPVITRVDPVRRSRNHGIMQTLLSCKIAVSATISLCRIDILTPGAKPKALETKCLRRMYQGMCKKNRLNTGPRVNIIN